MSELKLIKLEETNRDNFSISDSLHGGRTRITSDNIHEEHSETLISSLQDKLKKVEEELADLLINDEVEKVDDNKYNYLTMQQKRLRETISTFKVSHENHEGEKHSGKLNNKPNGSDIVNIDGEIITYKNSKEQYPFDATLKGLKDYPKWIAELDDFLQYHQFDNIIELSSEVEISPAENKILLKIINSSIEDKDLEVTQESATSVIRLLKKIKVNYKKKYSKKLRNTFWSKIFLSKKAPNFEKQCLDTIILIRLDQEFDTDNEEIIDQLCRFTNIHVISQIERKEGKLYDHTAMEILFFIEEIIKAEIEEDIAFGQFRYRKNSTGTYKKNFGPEQNDKKVSVREAHENMCHIDVNVLKDTFESNLIPEVGGFIENDKKVKEFFCAKCHEGKMKTYNHFEESMHHEV